MPRKKKKGNFALIAFLVAALGLVIFWRKADKKDFIEWANTKSVFQEAQFQNYWYEVLNGMRQPNEFDLDNNTANWKGLKPQWEAYKKQKYLW